jgi:hypothetical protein
VANFDRWRLIGENTMPDSEHSLTNEILRRYATRSGMRLWRSNTGVAHGPGRFVRFGVPGSPDLYGIIGPGGRYIGIETKSSTGRQREEQKVFESVVKSLGGIYILAYSIEDVVGVLEPLLSPVADG